MCIMTTFSRLGRRTRLIAMLSVTAIVTLSSVDVSWGITPGIQHRWNARYARTKPWHGNYYHTASGYPVPLVVPPTATSETKWGWGVAQTEVRPIHPQFNRAYRGDVTTEGRGFMGTPPWPSHTDQFGVYYIRGPW
jgi:hypothetical protein